MFDKLSKIKGFIFDIDGVMTTGSVLVTEEGQMLRSVNIKDGYAIQHAIKLGIKIAFISGGKSNGMLLRLQGLGVVDVYMGQSHKIEAYEQLKSKWNLEDFDICYMGDDMPDLPILTKVGLAACPKDACIDVIEIANYISPITGGNGCVRDLLEKHMKFNGNWLNNHSHSW